MEDNPLLLRLKELEALEKLVEKVGRIDLHAGAGAATSPAASATFSGSITFVNAVVTFGARWSVAERAQRANAGERLQL